jgi:hypothetical protein
LLNTGLLTATGTGAEGKPETGLKRLMRSNGTSDPVCAILAHISLLPTLSCSLVPDDWCNIEGVW